MTAEELAAAMITAHHLRPEQRYLICVDRNTVPVSVLERLPAILADRGIDIVLIKTAGRPQDVLQVIDLKPKE